MEGLFHVKLPVTASPEDVQAIKDQLSDIDTITDVGHISTRNLDPSSMIIWVQLIGGTLSAAVTAVSVIQKVIDIIRNKPIKGATIKFTNGTEVSVDHATTVEIEKVFDKTSEKTI